MNVCLVTMILNYFFNEQCVLTGIIQLHLAHIPSVSVISFIKKKKEAREYDYAISVNYNFFLTMMKRARC